MSIQLARIWERLRTSYWFIPGLMAIGAAGLAAGAEAVDHRTPLDTIEALAWIYRGGPDGARAVLSTVAGSMITVAGVVFSITMVALVLASSQFGPRLLRNFMRDTGNQVVLGTFIATFLYCLLALRAVRGQEDFQFVPHFSVTVGVVLGLASLGVLIYFIDHVATSIQAPAVVARVGRDLDAAIERSFPEEADGRTAGGDGGKSDGSGAKSDSGDGSGGEGRSSATEAEPEVTVNAERSGYMEVLDENRLLATASEHDLVIKCERCLGDHVLEGTPLASVVPEARMDEAVADDIRSAFHLASSRGGRADVLFMARQLVEIAVRALSPGINDPFTATNCVDRLAEALGRVAERPRPSERLEDDEERLRVILARPSFGDLLDMAFDQIREHGRNSAAVLASLLNAIGSVEVVARRPEDRAELLRHADLVEEAAREGLEDRAGRERVQALHSAISARLERDAPEG